MQKKGIVYRLTMVAGIGFIGAQTVGEVAYWRFYRKDRDVEIQEEKDAIEAERAEQRRNWVLARMLFHGFITESDYQKAVNEAVSSNLNIAKQEIEADYVAEMIRVALLTHDKYLNAPDAETLYTQAQQIVQSHTSKNITFKHFSTSDQFLWTKKHNPSQKYSYIFVPSKAKICSLLNKK